VDVYTTEEQQVEAIKKWWKKNGMSTVGAVLIGISIVVGGRVWMDQQNSHAEIASAKYDTMVSALNQGMTDIALDQSSSLIGQFSDTPYAALAALSSAKIKLAQGDLLAARTHIQWVLNKTDSNELKQIARIRLARIMLGDGDNQEALALLGQVDSGSFVASFEGLKGDIYLAMDQPEKAKSAYNLALNAAGPGSGNQDLLRMKLDDLGGGDIMSDGNVVIVK
jgi:predicted negative regulator of RcsB-dependent stress response